MKMTNQILDIPEEHYFYLDTNFIGNYTDKQPEWGGDISYVVYKRTYARPLANGKTEEYWQTCKRVVETAYTIQKSHILKAKKRWDEARAQRSAQKMYNYMWQLKFTPPGRGLWAMYLPLLIKKGGGAVNNCAFRSTKDIDLDFAAPFCFLMDFSMLGVGVGFDTMGAGKVLIKEPETENYTYEVDDTREGWVDLLRLVLEGFIGLRKLPGEFKVREYEIQVKKEESFRWQPYTCEGWDVYYGGLRYKEAPIKIFGGTSSGATPLIELIKDVTRILRARIGNTITSTDIVDIMNLIGKCVVSGNVRRSAELVIGDKDDTDFYKLKDPTEKNQIEARLKKFNNHTPELKALSTSIKSIEKELEDISKSSTQAVELSRKLIELNQERDALLYAIPEFVALQQEYYNLPLLSWRWASNNAIKCTLGMSYEKLGKQCATNGEPNPFWLELAQKYGRMIDPPDNRDYRVLGTNPCGEQSLEDGELCCLVETYPNRIKNMTEFLDVLKYAYLYAKTVTMIPTHCELTNEIISRNRRIGTSMAGIMRMYNTLGISVCKKWWDTGYKRIDALDIKYSEWLGIPRSNKKTSVKPGGSVPLLAGDEGGLKNAEAEYIFRTIRTDTDSAITKAHIDAGYRVEKDVYTTTSSVIYFPIHDTKSKRFAKDISVWEQVELAAALQAYWSDNQVSCTLTFKKEEAKDIPRILELYEGRLKSLTFLPLSEHGYIQAPYIACTEAEYTEAISKIKPIDWANINIENEAVEKFCEGQLCEAKRNE